MIKILYSQYLKLREVNTGLKNEKSLSLDMIFRQISVAMPALANDTKTDEANTIRF